MIAKYWYALNIYISQISALQHTHAKYKQWNCALNRVIYLVYKLHTMDAVAQELDTSLKLKGKANIGISQSCQPFSIFISNPT